ncbi:MAG: 6-carboxytetrahydropterin synthase [Cyanobacteria bacterium J06607_13]
MTTAEGTCLKTTSREHYPTEVDKLGSPVYRSVLQTQEMHDQPASFDYEISVDFSRTHCNPPVWHDVHPHDYRVTLVITSTRRPEDLYGLDMVEAERLLRAYVDELPECINDHPGTRDGTTEALCLYFAGRPLSDPLARLVSVSVAETPERVTRYDLPPF